MGAARRVVGAASVLLALEGASVADEPLAPTPSARFVGEGCRVREDGPIACPPVTSITIVRGETASVQLVLETREPLDRAALVLDVDRPLVVRSRREIFLPVSSRSHGVEADGDALPWSAAARPADAEVMGLVADPLTYDVAPELLAPRPGARTAIWVDVRVGADGGAGDYDARFVIGGAELSLAVEVIDADLPPIPVSSFAYVEVDELAGLPGPESARRELFEMLSAHHVTPVARLADVNDVARDATMLGDFAVVGAYGTLGDPTAEAIATLERIVRALPERVTDIVLYAVDEDCASSRPAAWRAAIAGSRQPAARRVRVLATCGHRVPGADVTMTTSDAFRPDEAARARAAGTELWVYNGRLPHAGPMALDAPPESLLWNGWIAARYDVGRWFYWNTNHWTDRNRGGRGARDLFRDTETFHNADGDVVLEDGVLVYPAFQREGFTSIAKLPSSADSYEPDVPFTDARMEGREQILGSIRLARLRRGAEDAALLALAYGVDAETTRTALARVVPRALGDVGTGSTPLFARAADIAKTRAELHWAIAKARREGRFDGPLDDAGARASLRRLRESTPAVAPPSAAGAIPIALAIFGGGALLALAFQRMRRRSGYLAPR